MHIISIEYFINTTILNKYNNVIQFYILLIVALTIIIWLMFIWFLSSICVCVAYYIPPNFVEYQNV
jgi:hypothetical protein